MDPSAEERGQRDDLFGLGGPFALFNRDVGRATVPQVGGGGFLSDASGLPSFCKPLPQDSWIDPVQVDFRVGHTTSAFL